MSEPFNEVKQLEMSLKAAQNMVGKATMAMDDNLLQAATEAVNNAHAQLNALSNSGPGTDEELLAQSRQLLAQCEEQINEARR
ncbi:hypothetical protein CIB95_08280 [Lottiidibacillus patelloidae]|uniref:Cytosolic protein n=1 Tax=Lottiidibacillus patelloidae TaxID=2670334 RepID=A0A263BV60_9BACI|nr:DUF2564 family protein [Lottiidibacillus patelloidae]OZM57442.1 hypothetical protein CIB95_08280 [Lottiidibacillus patelloidae]